MSLQTRLGAFITAVGADIKALKGPRVFGTDVPDPTSIVQSATDNAVQWVRASDGAWVAKVDPYMSGLIQTLDITSRAKTDGRSAAAVLRAEENGTYNDFLGLYFGGEASSLEVFQGDSSGTEPKGTIKARSGGIERLILASDGSSDFAQAIPVVQVLPSSPIHGQEVVFQNQSMMNNGVAWRLRYRAYNVDGSANTNTDKWECVGGGIFDARDPAGVSLSANTLAYSGPSHTIPLPGWYEATVGWNAYNSTGVNSGIIQSQMFNGSNVLWDSSGEDVIQGFMPTTGFGRVNGSRYGLFPIRLTAGSIFRLGYNADFNGSVVRFRHLGIKPIRVSAA